MDGADAVRRYWLEIWGDGNLDLVGEVFTDPYVRHNRNGTQTIGHKELRQDLVRFWRTMRASTVTIEDQAVAGDRVWTRVDIRGVNLETGEEAVVNFLHVARSVDGRLAEAWSLNAAEVDWRKPG